MKQICLFVFLCGFSFSSYTQSIDVENAIKSKPVQVSGGISANSVFYSSNQLSSRDPFAYFLNGSVNVNLFGTFNLPFSFTYSNADVQFSQPFRFNRLSLSPTYKNFTGHFGDVAMTFSPYTLSGHQFTGGGLEYKLNDQWEFSVMSGQLLQATSPDENENTIPAFQRMGYGGKINRKSEKIELELIGFYAKDNESSINQSFGIANPLTPKENLVASIKASYKLSEQLSLNVEYAASALSDDTTVDGDSEGQNVAGLFMKGNSSTQFYDAIKADVSTNIADGSLSLAYERIDPGYQTLGAYYFNNDLENITVNGSKPLFNNKLNLGFNLGFQQDDLNNSKDATSRRVVGAVNGSLQLTDKINVSGSYSNFQNFTNVNLNQFDNINQNDFVDNIDTLDYIQVSQSANLNVNYTIAQSEKSNHNVNGNFSFNDVANKKGGIIRVGGASTFYNYNVAYNVSLPEQKLNLGAGANYTLNLIGRENATTFGPNVNVGKQFLDGKLNTNLTLAYNQANAIANSTSIFNIRNNWSFSLLEKHNFTATLGQMNRATDQSDPVNEFTGTLGYDFSF